uniref:Uncharacterized protein n=1 Tax=Globodera rostochiensis TaxID=31243 RepID=A0A914I9Z8_GLORO
MDDYLTVFENQSNGGTKFESVHSRFERLHVSRKDVQWILCDFCGSVVNKLLYENHIVRHEFIDLAYSLHRFELAEEQKRQKLIRRIQEKEKRQQRKNLCVAGFDLEENTNSSVSLSSSSSDESSTSDDDDSSDSTSGTDEFDLSLPGCSTAAVVRPRKRKKVAAAVVKRANTAVVNKKTAVKKKSNRNAMVSSVVVCKVPAVEQQQQPVQKTTAAVATDDLLEVVKMDVVFPPEKFLLPNGHHQPAGVERMQKAEAVGDRHREETEEQRLRKEENRRKRVENKQRRRRNWLEAELMKRHLGPNHHRVFVDNSAALEAYFDRRTGRVSLDSLRSSPPQRRRSRRGVLHEELQCLV